MNIHPTAIISPEAKVGDNVEVGPYAIIESGAEIGSNCVIQAHAVIEGSATLGQGNVVGYGTIIGSAPQDLSHTPKIKSRVIIGDNNRIREHVTIHRGSKEDGITRVGDHCFLMTGCHLAHDVQIGNHVIITNNVLLAGHIEVGDRAVLGGGSVFHQFIRIGRNAMVSGGIRFGKDIPPFTIGGHLNTIIGLNAIGLRRSGISACTRLALQEAYRIVFLGNKPRREAVQELLQLEHPTEVREFLEFIASSKRGCCMARKRDRDATAVDE
jgi:UDP-N-acetylglucosamine acyltransferase